ncbi:MAG TPA: HlyD family efflux transporter periplasmic adaptor subunit [Thermoanaerobaculia bacterium]|nr:HlyD family efflux transporter periplasmic adaptor subunit [Thermoanaerobaculia bacterium]
MRSPIPSDEPQVAAVAHRPSWRSLAGVAALLADRRSRSAIVALLVLAPILALLPYMRGMVSRNAVVTSFVYTVRAPIPGRLGGETLRPGATVVSGKTAAFVDDPRFDDDLVNELRARSRAHQSLVERLTVQERRLDELGTRFAGRLSGVRGGAERESDQRLMAARATLLGLEAQLVEERSRTRRARSLREAGVTSAAELDAAEAALELLQASRDAQEAEVRRLEGVRAELVAGRFLGDGIDEAVLLQDQLSRLELARLELDLARVRAAAELASVASRLERAEERLELVRRAPVEVPDGVLVWQVHAVAGQLVEAGAPLFSFVDCRELLLDMRMDDSVLSLVDSGQPSWFRLFGSRRRDTARALYVRGSRAVFGDGTLATTVERGHRDGQVLSRIDRAPALADGTDFCGIGRTAYARLDGIGLYRELLRRLLL